MVGCRWALTAPLPVYSFNMHRLFLVVLFACWDLSSSLSSVTNKGHHQNYHLLILGLGNVGQAVFDQARASQSFVSIRGTKRNPITTSSNDDDDDDDDGSVIPFSLENIKPLLPDCTHLLVTIPPNPSMSDVMTMVSQHLSPHAWIGVVSTTGVYGNHDGAWVTEESPLKCGVDSNAQRYVEYEHAWQQSLLLSTPTLEDDGLDSRTIAVFRCAGLYGPTRSALHTVWNQGYDLIMEETTTNTNRIHEYDVANAILTAMMDHCVGVYNLSDDEPENRNVVMQEAAMLLKSIGREPPSSEMMVMQATLQRQKSSISSSSSNGSSSSSGRGQRRGIESKLLSNKKMKESLISELTFPTYRQGLRAILEDKRNAWWN
jgi:hypothetical protein